jgi:hypothetical protein
MPADRSASEARPAGAARANQPADGPGSNRASRGAPASSFLETLRGGAPVRSVELRPPRSDLPSGDSVEAWIDLHHAVRSLIRDRRYVLFTDDAVGSREEESIQHLTSNLGTGAPLSRIVPFLTCKHTLDYCLLFAQRAASRGLGAVTVTGGDTSVGPPRCLPRSRDLRERIRERVPGLTLGAWVNPFRDAKEQVGLLMEEGHEADYFLTQVVSHHDLEPVDRFLDEAERQGLETPGLFGVFFYRSPSPRTLERLSDFIPVPVEGIIREFEEGASPEEICARTIRALEERGVRRIYVSNLALPGAARVMREVEGRL